VAREIVRAKGVVGRVLRWLDEMAKADDGGVLGDELRAAAAGEAD
jgi:hypothetical protein